MAMAFDADDVSVKPLKIGKMVAAAHMICDTSPRGAWEVILCAKFCSQAF
jgi:hypothetical protein